MRALPSRRMRPILFLTRSLHSGGAERQLVLLARQLKRCGVDVSVATFYGEGEFVKDLVAEAIPIHDLRKSGRWSTASFFFRLWRLIRRERPGVLHSYLTGPNLVALLLKPLLRWQGGAVVCGVRASALDLSRYDFATRVSEHLSSYLLPFADAVICNSHAGLAHISASASRSARFHAVDNGVDTQRFRFDEQGRKRCREDWNLPEGALAIGLVGRHDPVKDHALFLHAAARLADANSEARFVLVGSEVAGTTERIREVARQLGLERRIVWAGHRSDLPAVYSALDVLCLSSESEGFPNVVAEAMSCGLPCVSTDVGDARRLIGDCGWVVDARTPEALARGLEEALQACPTWDRSRPRHRIEANFSVETLADRTLQVLGPFLARDAT